MNWSSLFNPTLAVKAIPLILEGLPLTLFLSLMSFILGISCGFFVALLRLSKYRILRFIASLHISFMRGIPLMVLLFVIYYGLPFAGIRINAIGSSILAFTMMSSAYSSEVIRASLLAVDFGQWEAAYSLGLTKSRIYQKIIIPQAIRISLPPLSNILLDMVKSTSITATITVPEMFNKAQIIGGSYSDYMTVYITVALLYWIICSLYALVQLIWEKKITIH